MAEEVSCGAGIAANAELPNRMAAVAAAMADVLTRHTDALDPEEPAGAAEREAWLTVAVEQRQLAVRLTAVADRMEAQRGLASASHDMSVLTGSEATEAFAHFVHAQQRLNELLSEQLVEYRAMLAAAEGEQPGQ